MCRTLEILDQLLIGEHVIVRYSCAEDSMCFELHILFSFLYQIRYLVPSLFN